MLNLTTPAALSRRNHFMRRKTLIASLVTLSLLAVSGVGGGLRWASIVIDGLRW